MTLKEMNIHHVQLCQRTSSPVVPPAAVWDLNTRVQDASRAERVRTLRGNYRTRSRSIPERSTQEYFAEVPLENRRGSVRSLVLGVFMGFSMIVGAAVGGVFAESPSHSQGPVDYTAEIQSVDRH